MIKLVKNEFFKIFHKVSTYIILLISVLFIIITNVIYFYYDDLSVEDNVANIDINEINEYINNYNPNNDNIDDYVYNLALLDCYNLAHQYETNSWQYNVFMTEYLSLDIEYYKEQHQENIDEEKIADLNKEMLTILQAVSNDDWQYFANNKKVSLENSIENYNEKLASNLTDTEKIEYNKMLFIAEEELELIDYRLTQNVPFGNDYLNHAITDIENDLYLMADYLYDENVDSQEYENVIKDYNENKYILEEKLDTKSSNTLRSVIMNFFDEYSFLILVFVIMIAGGIVSEEFNKGTIKSLLTVPHKRSRILGAKYLTVLISIPLIIIFLVFIQIIVGGILLGFDSLSIPVAIFNLTTNNLEVLNVFGYFFIQFLANLPEIILLVTFAFACSVILNSTSFAITITFCGIIASQIINSLAYTYNIKILNYFVTTNWNFTDYLFGGHSMFGVTIQHSALVCVIYLIIMLSITFVVFIKKDIKNI